MKNTIKTICLALAMACGSFGGNALADGHDKMSPYAGLGYSFASIENDTNGVKLDGTMPTIFGGMMFHPNFGAEVGLHRLNLDISASSAASSAESTITSFYLVGVGKYAIDGNFSVYGKAGFHRWEDEGKIGTGAKVSIDSIDGVFGAGMQYDLSEHASARLEYVRHLLDEKTDNAGVDGEADIIGFHLLYRL